MKLRLMLGGARSYLPIRRSYRGTGGTTSARYCYSVWLRHLRLCHEAGIDRHPESLVELGPGDTIGVGLAALLTGAQRYHGLDVVDHANEAANLAMLDALVELVARREPIPDGSEWPLLHPRLARYDFPADLLPAERLRRTLAPERIAAIRRAIPKRVAAATDTVRIAYLCPWSQDAIEPGSADMICSQVTLQVMDHAPGRDVLRSAFESMSRWLRPGGAMSHMIDFTHPGGREWNHHWTMSDLQWRIIRGRRPYHENRLPLSAYLGLFAEYGFRVLRVQPVEDRTGATRERLAPGFRNLPESDLVTRAAHIVAVKA